MAKYAVTFVGDTKRRQRDRNDPEAVTVRGVEFPLEDAVHLDVETPEGEALVKKLKGNHHFKVELADEAVDKKTAKPDKKKGKVKADEAKAEADGASDV